MNLAQAPNALTLHTELPEVGLSAIRALAALALVLAIFFGGVWLFRNGQRLAWRKTGPPRLSILESRALGSRFALYVVGYDQQRMLIGSSPAGLNLLSQLPPAVDAPAQTVPVVAQASRLCNVPPAAEASAQTVALSASRDSVLQASFRQCLQQVLGRK